MSDEIWKEFRKPFEVSSLGRVRNVKTGRILKGAKDAKGYRTVCLSYGGRGNTHTKYVHRMVAALFLGPKPSPQLQINHRDGNKLNNAADNLEYVTLQENIQHAVRLGLTASGERSRSKKYPETLSHGERSPFAKLTDAKVIELRQLYATGNYSQRALAARYGIAPNTVKEITIGRRWKHLLQPQPAQPANAATEDF